MKACKDCGERLPLSQFYTHFEMRDGHLNSCKECRKVYQKTRDCKEYDRKRGRTEKRKAWVRKSAHKYAGKRVDYIRKYRAKNPGKYKAVTALNNAVRDGKIIRGPCEICGVSKAHGHHDDYSKPLEVRWLCPKHHGEAHWK